jgi:hypothetical protein
MKTFYTLTLVMMCSMGLAAQTMFQKYLQVPASSGILYRSIQTGDGGFASAGQVTDMTTFLSSKLIMKTDSNGIVTWIRQGSYAGSDVSFQDLARTPDGIVAVGTSMNMSTFISQAVVEKFDASGASLWSHAYISPGASSIAKKIQVDLQGNLYVLGTVDVSGSMTDYFILKLDGSGHVLQQTTFGTPDTDYPLAFLRNSDGDLFIGGWKNTGAGENIHLIKLNSSMAVSWSKLISGSSKYFCYDLKAKPAGDLVLAGRYDDGATSYDVLLAEISDGNGTVDWAKSYSPLDGLPAFAYGLAIRSDGRIAITGSVEDSTRGTLLMGTNSDGTVSWSERIGSLTGEYGSGYGITETHDGGYLVCGNRGDNNNSIVQFFRINETGEGPCNRATYPFSESTLTLPIQDLTVHTNTGNLSSQDVSFTIISYSSLENICPVNKVYEKPHDDGLSAFPDPSDGRFTISFGKPGPGSSIRIFNSRGAEVYSAIGAEKMLTGQLPVDLKVPAGIYLINLDNGQQRFTRKILIY